MALLEHYLPIFKQVLLMTGDPQTATHYEENRQTCVELLEHAMFEAGKLALDEGEKEAARVAVIAWMDETVMRSALPWRQRWQSELLQRKYLDITTAGECFFTLLAELSPTQVQARKVFLFCLQQGFNGQYNTPADKDALRTVMAELRSVCLPEAWQAWPNDAPVIPNALAPAGTITQRLSPLVSVTLGVALLYAVLFVLLYPYVV